MLGHDLSEVVLTRHYPIGEYILGVLRHTTPLTNTDKVRVLIRMGSVEPIKL